MNKAELIDALAVHFGDNKAEASRALKAVLDTITEQVAKGEKVSITGFGVFEKMHRAARMVRNPRTGERKKAKATDVPRFRPGSELKALVSGEKKIAKAPATKPASAKKAAPAKTTATKSAAVKAPAKSTTKAPAKSVAKTTAKAPARTSAAKTTAAKKATVAKTATKTTTAKKTTTAAKKTAPAKAAATKTAAKTTTAKKTAAKKTAK